MNTDKITKDPSSTDFIQFVIFDIHDGNGEKSKPLRMALNVQKIKEVVEFSNVSLLPSSGNQVLGIYDLRGAPVPLLNVLPIIAPNTASKFSAASFSKLIICELQRIWIAIPVVRTGRIVNCAGKDFLPPPAVLDSSGPLYYAGLIRRGTEYTPVLDIDFILHGIGYQTQTKSEHKIPAGAYAGKRILIAEDSKTIQKKLDHLFKKLGCEVIIEADGKRAMERLVQENYRFDLIFTDIEMPLMDGISMARAIKKIPQAAQIPILFNSALSNPALISDIETDALGRYLVKFDEDLITRYLGIEFDKKAA